VSEILQSKGRSLLGLCRLLGRSRQAYYQRRKREERAVLSGELIVQEVLDIRERQRYLGARKLYHMLSGFLEEHRIVMGRDAFFDLLREYSLLVRKRKPRKPRTTLSYWRGKRYPNLAKELVPVRANQLWVSDITYIGTLVGFGYLSLVTDAYSRKIVGYCLSEGLDAAGCVRALRMALKANPERAGLVHHSDRGTQYYSSEYIKTLGPKIRISMTEKSDPLENAIAERVNGIIKQEFLDTKYANIPEARRAVAEAVSIYNNERPHSSIENLVPAEAHNRTGELKKHWKNYFRKDKAEEFQATA
jgi:transposase InsO family protein